MDTTALVAVFDTLLRRDLGAANYRAAVAANRVEANPAVCHTHDYIDANMTMAEAFQTVLGREVDVDRDDDAAIWNAAWDAWVQQSCAPARRAAR